MESSENAYNFQFPIKQLEHMHIDTMLDKTSFDELDMIADVFTAGFYPASKQPIDIQAYSCWLGLPYSWKFKFSHVNITFILHPLIHCLPQGP